MRIGVIAGEYPPMQGGVGAYTRILARALADLGHELFLYARQGAVEGDVRLDLTPRARNWGVGMWVDVRRWSLECSLDCISLQYQTAAFDMSPFIHGLPHVVPMPLITTFHDLRFPYLFPKAGRLRPWIVDHLARASSAAITTNAEDYARLAPLTETALIPIGSNILAEKPFEDDHDPDPDTVRTRRIRVRLGAQSGEFWVGFFGLVNASKGLDILIDALTSLRAEGVSAHLMIVGGTAGSSDPTNIEYLNAIQAQLQRLDLHAVTHWTGYLDEAEVSAHLAACDAVALPFRDGASTRRGSLMAAIRCGCAIVTTEPRVAMPLFGHEQNMLLVPPETASLTTALRRLQEPALAARLREGARTLSAHFEWPQLAQQTATFLAQIIEGRRT